MLTLKIKSITILVGKYQPVHVELDTKDLEFKVDGVDAKKQESGSRSVVAKDLLAALLSTVRGAEEQAGEHLGGGDWVTGEDKTVEVDDDDDEDEKKPVKAKKTKLADDDDDEDEKPAKASKKKSADDDDDEEPAKSKKSSKSSDEDDDDDDDDDEDEKPAKKSGKKSSKEKLAGLKAFIDDDDDED